MGAKGDGDGTDYALLPTLHNTVASLILQGRQRIGNKTAHTQRRLKNRKGTGGMHTRPKRRTSTEEDLLARRWVPNVRTYKKRTWNKNRRGLDSTQTRP